MGNGNTISGQSLADLVARPWAIPTGGLGNAKVEEIFRFLESNPVNLPGQPMRYEPLNIMSKVTNRPFASSPAFVLQPEDIACQPGAEDVRTCYCAVLQLACGGLDECHDRITPFSWDSSTLFGGPAVPGSVARGDATYIHHLVHMREGQHPGEFGTGWNNAGFWAGSVGSHPTFAALGQASAMVAQAAQPEVAQQLPQELQSGGWSPRSFIRLCSSTMESGDPGLTAYCEKVANVQYRLLLDHLRTKM